MLFLRTLRGAATEAKKMVAAGFSLCSRNYMLIDTHAHLDFKEFDSDRDEVIKRAFDSGIEKIINIGCNLERSKNSIELAKRYDNVYATVGIHPHDVASYQLLVASYKLRKLAKQDKVVAIGECGLDYYRIESVCGRSAIGGNDELSPEKKLEISQRVKVKNLQKEFFKLQIDLAKELSLPIILHCRSAFEDLFEILKRAGDLPRGVTHCFSGTLDWARKFLNLGFLISFTGSITYARPQSEILEVVKEVPLDKIMIETDCPYLAPVSHRGERNEPAYVRYIAEKIAEMKGIDFKEVAKKTTEQAIKLFNLK